LRHLLRLQTFWTSETLVVEALTTAEETVTAIPDQRKKATTRVLVKVVGQTSPQAKSAQGLRSIRTSNSSRSKSDRDSAKKPHPLGGGVFFLGLEKVFTYLEVKTKPELYSEPPKALECE
jgi:hypothetical protein